MASSERNGKRGRAEMSHQDDDDCKMIPENGRSVAHRSLPPVPKEHEHKGTILLFYQYKEPEWTEKEHSSILKQVIALGKRLNITGRGRVAPEGLNCTLSGRPEDVRNFCAALREMDPLFHNTDFKLTDGIPLDKLFKSLSIRKTVELVAYGLPGTDKAPSLEHFAGEHLEADAYHEAMMQENTVIVDVRNAYESALGSFQPPPGGAELIDPQMRNSIEFPKWLNDPSTKEKLNGKTVLMYCTGGIRCERATALLNQMSTADPESVKPKAVYELRGGIERYLKTFPKGGFWKGKNYLFDRRMEQCASEKPAAQVEQETNSRCCLCRQKWTVYRGKFKCCKGLCGVPVIVCDDCRTTALADPEALTCELCKQGFLMPQNMPDLTGLKRQALAAVTDEKDPRPEEGSSRKRSRVENPQAAIIFKDRLFVSRLPLTVTRTKLAETLGQGDVKVLHWLTDKNSGAFYGSCLVQMASEDAAAAVMKNSSSTTHGQGHITLKLDKKKFRVSYAFSKENEKSEWPPVDHKPSEYPPVGM